MRLDTPLRTAVSGALTPPSAGTHKRGAGTSGPAVTCTGSILPTRCSVMSFPLPTGGAARRIAWLSSTLHQRFRLWIPTFRGGQTPKVRVWPRASVYRRPRYSSAKLKWGPGLWSATSYR